MIVSGQRWKRHDVIVEIIGNEEGLVIVKVIAIFNMAWYSVGQICKFSNYKFETGYLSPYENHLRFEYMPGQDAPI